MPRSRAQQILDLTIPFIGVLAGAATVVLLRDARALIPSPPYWPWLMAVASLCCLALILAMGTEEGWEEDDDVDPAERWRAIGMAYLGGVVAAATFVASGALISWLERVF